MPASYFQMVQQREMETDGQTENEQCSQVLKKIKKKKSQHAYKNLESILHMGKL